MKVALDTNILAYAEGVDSADRREAALELVGRLQQDETVVPVQVLGELFNVLTRKAGRLPEDARIAVLSWRDAFPSIETSSGVMVMATDLAATHRVGIWEAVVLSAAAQAGCRLLLSEDLQAGFTWAGVTVVNPFESPRHPLLDALLDDQSR